MYKGFVMLKTQQSNLVEHRGIIDLLVEELKSKKKTAASKPRAHRIIPISFSPAPTRKDNEQAMLFAVDAIQSSTEGDEPPAIYICIIGAYTNGAKDYEEKLARRIRNKAWGTTDIPQYEHGPDAPFDWGQLSDNSERFVLWYYEPEKRLMDIDNELAQNMIDTFPSIVT
jgi:hypothetical protein